MRQGPHRHPLRLTKARVIATRPSLLLAVTVAASIVPLLGCGTFESQAITEITIRNDTSRFVVVKDCRSDACDNYRYTRRLAPHAAASAHDYGDGTSWWLVGNRSGKVLGCLELGIGQRQEGYTLKLSELQQCPG